MRSAIVLALPAAACLLFPIACANAGGTGTAAPSTSAGSGGAAGTGGAGTSSTSSTSSGTGGAGGTACTGVEVVVTNNDGSCSAGAVGPNPGEEGHRAAAS